MLEGLLQFTPEVTPPGPMTPLEEAAPSEIQDAQLRTLDWLEELGVKDEDVAGELEKTAARKAFGALTTLPLHTPTPEDEQRFALVALKTPAAVRHLTGMLAAYDWEFVAQAKELRGYTVAKIVEETTNPNANIRLKALQLLGKVTEVGLYTDKVHVTKNDVSDEELEQRIKAKLRGFMEVVDVVENVRDPETPLSPDTP